MQNKSKKFFGVAMLAASFAVVAFVPNLSNAEGHFRKHHVWHNDPHNGHVICIPPPAVVAHLREHVGDIDQGYCTCIGECPVPAH